MSSQLASRITSPSFLTAGPAFNERIFVTKTSGFPAGTCFDTKLPPPATLGHAKT
jgi:hypothetical protein